jgi:tRNA-2-methylthio-N6-dimethylallyladenosine synthase
VKYHLITYGCQMNTADSEEMARPLEARGFTSTSDVDQADVVIMNTCTVREQAEHRAWSNLGRLEAWKQEKPGRMLIVAGCAASLWGDSVKKRYPYIDLVSPATKIEEFPALIEQVLKDHWNFTEENEKAFSPPRTPTSTDHSPKTRVPGTNLFGDDCTAYVTIMRGCNYNCSYCIVPQVRGREVYRPPGEILSEIQGKVSLGMTEVMLLGQTVNSYHSRLETGPMDFADLLRAVNALEGVERIRFMSPHPRHMRERTIQAMAESPKVCRHIHLPAQSGSNHILKKMQRHYTREDYAAIVQQLRAAMPGLMITTDMIVGYPGETPEDFSQTLSFLKEVEFDGLFAFKFSPRPGTVAAEDPEDIPETLKEQRLQQVLALSKNIVNQKAPWGN